MIINPPIEDSEEIDAENKGGQQRMPMADHANMADAADEDGGLDQQREASKDADNADMDTLMDEDLYMFTCMYCGYHTTSEKEMIEHCELNGHEIYG
ncbi:hypothetical protein LPJ75_003376 [Coemansia sp. RSA 2598]|nr:hypothetical protein LPJ75_003376 [Coemansia sp. RSA 2598]